MGVDSVRNATILTSVEKSLHMQKVRIKSLDLPSYPIEDLNLIRYPQRNLRRYRSGSPWTYPRDRLSLNSDVCQVVLVDNVPEIRSFAAIPLRVFDLVFLIKPCIVQPSKRKGSSVGPLLAQDFAPITVRFLPCQRVSFPSIRG